MQDGVIGLNTAIRLGTALLTAQCSRAPDQAEGCVATEQAVCMLGITEKGKPLQLEGKVLESERLFPLLPARPRCPESAGEGGDGCSSLRRTRRDEIMPSLKLLAMLLLTQTA